jgi:hypothetical protein
VEQERAERNRLANLKQNAEPDDDGSDPLVPTDRDEDRGETRVKVGKKLGIGHSRAQQLNTVANTMGSSAAREASLPIDTLKQAGSWGWRGRRRLWAIGRRTGSA